MAGETEMRMYALAASWYAMPSLVAAAHRRGAHQPVNVHQSSTGSILAKPITPARAEDDIQFISEAMSLYSTRRRGRHDEIGGAIEISTRKQKRAFGLQMAYIGISRRVSRVWRR